MNPDDPNEITERLAARLGEPADANARALRRALYGLAADVGEIEWRATHTGHVSIHAEAVELRRQIEAGDWDSCLDVARTGAGKLVAALDVWDEKPELERNQISFIWAFRDARLRAGGDEFWRHAKAFKASHDWGFGDGEPAINRAIDAAERYGVAVRGEPWGPSEPRGTKGGWGKRGMKPD